ncbi:MAG: hypothetical protein QOJ62_899 [Actinomycetota bacterium]|nr:hypothetical protein [Actinomycetota bacterium]
MAGSVAVAMSVGLGIGAGPGTALASGTHTTGVETRAAIAPALTAGRGAQVPFVEQEAENAATNGTVIGPDRTAYTLAAEASGRSAVQLSKAGDYVEFTLTKEANAINFRYSIPDAPAGGGITAPIDIYLNGKLKQTATLTSQYSWLYSVYPFSNDPNADPPPQDQWWIPEPRPVSHPFRPSHFYDEQRLLLPRTYDKGAKVRFQVPAGSNASWYVIDLLDSQEVDRPAPQPANSLSVVQFGADRTGATDAADAFDAAIAAAKAAHKTVFIPAGTYQINRHIIVDNVTVKGAGNWFSIIRGHLTTVTHADGTTEQTGPGFYAKYIEDGGSTNVHLSNFAIYSDVRSRVDTDQVNGIGGAMGGGSSVSGLYLQHTKVGMWFDGPFSGLTVKNNIIVDQIADGLNLRDGISHVNVTNNFIRNTGDDGLAMWSNINADHDNVFDHNTVQSPVLANDIAIYGGTDNAVTNNLVADPVREGSGLQVGTRFNSTPFTGNLTFSGNTTVRAGILDTNWNLGIGAMWFYVLQGSITANVQVTDSNFLDNTYDALMFVADWPVKDTYVINNVHFKNIHVDGTGTSVVNARAAGWATFENVDARNVGAAGINDCGTFHFNGPPEFQVQLLGGNDGGWTNTTTCDDRPPRVQPPAPSPW